MCIMLDCINSNFLGNDSYREIEDVTCSLQLMLDKPLVYLHKLDVDKLFWLRLGLDDTDFEWKNEHVSLQCTYWWYLLGLYELAIITGMSAAGKSTMAKKLGNFITGNGGLFLWGTTSPAMFLLPPWCSITIVIFWPDKNNIHFDGSKREEYGNTIVSSVVDSNITLGFVSVNGTHCKVIISNGNI